MGREGRAGPSSFFESVYEVVRLVPHGRVTTYGAIAEYVGTRGSARMVGWAMNAAHDPVNQVPAHRVVNRNGLLTGKHHFGTPRMMEQLLENEGVRIKDDRVVDFSHVLWEPGKELGYVIRGK
jgi:methylated-DNA-protein-cysteine methyltransferase related protein